MNLSRPVRRLQKPQLHETKNKKKQQDRLELKKFCRTCRHHTVHRSQVGSRQKAVSSKPAYCLPPTAYCFLQGRRINGYISGLQNRSWGFKSLRPCQSFRREPGFLEGKGNYGRAGRVEKSTWVQVRDYFFDVRTEMKRVTWPNRQEISSTTVMVLITTFLFGFYFWVCDQVFMASVSRILAHFLHGG